MSILINESNYLPQEVDEKKTKLYAIEVRRPFSAALALFFSIFPKNLSNCNPRCFAPPPGLPAMMQRAREETGASGDR